MDYDFSHWKELPRISCWCCVFGREELLEEAVYSFLMQDYPGEKELVILNDYEEQNLVFEHPEVRIYNVKERYPTLATKMSDLLDMCKYEYLAPWAPDDICMPRRLSKSVERMHKGGPLLHLGADEKNMQYYAPGGWTIVWYENDNIRWQYTRSYDHGATLYSRKAFNEGKHYDLDERRCLGSQIEEKMKMLGYWSFDMDIEPGETFYLYRRFPDIPKWYNLHKAGKDSNLQIAHKHYEQFATTGDFEIKPHWEIDYSLLLNEHIGLMPNALVP